MPASESQTPVGARLPGGLVYVTPDMPGLQRVRRGKSFAYRLKRGAIFEAATLR
jgi:DNA topoisomerase-1